MVKGMAACHGSTRSLYISVNPSISVCLACMPDKCAVSPIKQPSPTFFRLKTRARLPIGFFSEYHTDLKCFLGGLSWCRTRSEEGCVWWYSVLCLLPQPWADVEGRSASDCQHSQDPRPRRVRMEHQRSRIPCSPQVLWYDGALWSIKVQ